MKDFYKRCGFKFTLSEAKIKVPSIALYRSVPYISSAQISIFTCSFTEPTFSTLLNISTNIPGLTVFKNFILSVLTDMFKI